VNWKSYSITRQRGAHCPSFRQSEEAEQAIRNDPLDMNYEVIDGEERWRAIGHTDEYRVLLVVWTVRTGALRIVSARAVGRRARETYLRAKGLLT
jgi:uncharacterized DUF497 family protein